MTFLTFLGSDGRATVLIPFSFNFSPSSAPHFPLIMTPNPAATPSGPVNDSSAKSLDLDTIRHPKDASE